jgi:hypothetical protein
MLNAQTKHSGILAGKYCVTTYALFAKEVEMFKATGILSDTSMANFCEKKVALLFSGSWDIPIFLEKANF